MTAPLSICTNEEQRAAIQFLWAKGVPRAKINHRLSAQYGNSAILQRSVYDWIPMSKNGRKCVTDYE